MLYSKKKERIGSKINWNILMKNKFFRKWKFLFNNRKKIDSIQSFFFFLIQSNQHVILTTTTTKTKSLDTGLQYENCCYIHGSFHFIVHDQIEMDCELSLLFCSTRTTTTTTKKEKKNYSMTYNQTCQVEVFSY